MLLPLYARSSLSRAPFHPETTGRTAFGVAALVAIVAVYGRLLGELREWELAHKARNAQPWWFGYARDSVNLLVFAGLTAGFVTVGVSPPVALLLAFFYGLSAYGMDYALSGARRTGAAPTYTVQRQVAATGVVLLLLAPALVAPSACARGVALTIDALFGLPH
jgi:hypothetical protein